MNFPFTLNQIFWMLTFAAQLTLLVVLMGRDRMRRFPLFSLSIALYAVRLLSEVLLNGRMAMVPYRLTMLLLSDLMVIASLLVAVEVAVRTFRGASSRARAIGGAAALVIASVPTLMLGRWPSFQGFSWHNLLAVMNLMQLFAVRADLFFDVLILAVAILVLIFGARFGAGWRSHVRRIALGQALIALSWITLQIVWSLISSHTHPKSEAEYERLMNLGVVLMNCHKGLYLAVMIGWILLLWPDEPAAGQHASTEKAVAAIAQAEETPKSGADGPETDKVAE